MGLISWFLRLFAGNQGKRLKKGPIPDRELDMTMISAFHEVMEGGQFIDADWDIQMQLDCERAIMKAFTDLSEYELEPRDLTRAYKQCKMYAQMVRNNTYI